MIVKGKTHRIKQIDLKELRVTHFGGTKSAASFAFVHEDGTTCGKLSSTHMSNDALVAYFALVKILEKDMAKGVFHVEEDSEEMIAFMDNFI